MEAAIVVPIQESSPASQVPVVAAAAASAAASTAAAKWRPPQRLARPSTKPTPLHSGCSANRDCAAKSILAARCAAKLAPELASQSPTGRPAGPSFIPPPGASDTHSRQDTRAAESVFQADRPGRAGAALIDWSEWGWVERSLLVSSLATGAAAASQQPTAVARLHG